ncbi:putative acetyltransferase [Fulvimarina manganoxydans]|uniref:Putative acetyltransferase n=1 Tax=Fulvimarina manganoxydans TaxID=937218 RepID=A0A1W2ENP0_9HYPH|nr:GNAT family N-acetyltransferase [Fulvimarina manganoxydans]SMD11320.1 putative acetyltransferase [Fulvimarina manganoxydans]
MTSSKSERHEIGVRAAEPSDLDALADIMNGHDYRFGTMRLPHESREAARSRLFERPGQTSLVAEIESEIVGLASLVRLSDRRAHVGLIGMGVRDGWSGRGVGTALLSELIDLADNWLGLVRLELDVYADNGPGIALYRKFGFRDEGVRPAAAIRDGAYADMLMMGRLRPPSPLPGDGIVDP